MKKILFTIIISTTILTSCVIESYEKPKKTTIGYNISEQVRLDIFTKVLIADVVRAADMWRNAPTPQEKFDIEDKYFNDNTKLREYGDTIAIVDHYNLHTFGKPLSESAWKIIPLSNAPWIDLAYEVSLIGVGQYRISTFNNGHKSSEDLILQLIIPDKKYSISGSSTILYSDHTSYYDEITYKITAEVKYKLKNEELILYKWQSSNFKPLDGCVDIRIYKSNTELEQDKIGAKYTLNGVQISYRGFNDFHAYHSNFPWY